MKPILCLDFDGVCHSYSSGWQGADVISDNAVPGLFEFLQAADPMFDIQVFGSRSSQPGGIEAMASWFRGQRAKWLANGGRPTGDVAISFPTGKPAAFLTLDDRGLRFDGTFPDPADLLGFVSWNKRGKTE